MKKFKKSLMAAFLTAAMVLCAFASTVPTSAATLTADQYYKKMTKASAKAKSYELTTTNVQNMVSGGQTTNTKMVQKEIYFRKPAMKIKAVSTTTVKMNGETSKAKTITYAKKNAKGKIISYVSLDGKKYEKIDMSSWVDNLSSIDNNVYSNLKIVKDNVKVNNVNTVQISAQITGEDFGKAIESTFAALGMESDDIDSISMDYSGLESVNATFWIDKKTYLPIRISTDTTAFVNGYMAMLMQAMDPDGAADLDISYSKVIITQDYTKYNKATDFKFPKACK